jgi:hypothetical protein
MMVTHQQMRAQVAECICALGDAEYQTRVWINRQFPHAKFFDDLSMNVGFLYDTAFVMDDPHRRIGDVFVDSDEADSVRALAEILGPIIDRLGGASDAAYLADSE